MTRHFPEPNVIVAEIAEDLEAASPSSPKPPLTSKNDYPTRKEIRPQPPQKFGLTSLLLTDVQICSMVARVISKKPLLPLPPLHP
jgi:hypothetical protein